MALATRCPHCQTTFRVAHDQLKLRSGLVRCGACKQIFNGVENLLRAEDLPPSPVSVPSIPPADLPKAGGTGSTADQVSEPEHPAPLPSAMQQPVVPAPSLTAQTAATQRANPEAAASDPSGKDMGVTSIDAGGENNHDPLQRMTLMDFTGLEDQDQSNDANAPDTDRLKAAFENDALAVTDSMPPDELDRTIDELQRKPWRKTKKRPGKSKDRKINTTDPEMDSTEPGFVKSARQQQRIGRALRIAMSISSAVLLIGVLAQSMVIFRDQIAARFPQTAPFLVRGCAIFGCRIELPVQIDLVSIESSELQAVASIRNVFSLVALLRNRAAIAQAWPNLELTLNDANGKPIMRRIFVPRDYVSTLQDVDKGFAANSEQPVKLTFSLSELQASGYRIYLFYP